MAIPRISLNSHNLSTQITHSLKETGFVVLSDVPGIPEHLEPAYSFWRSYFGCAQKGLDSAKGNSQAGYFKFGTEKAKDSQIYDLKEFYHMFFPFSQTLSVPNSKNLESVRYLAHNLNALGIHVLSMIQTELESMQIIPNCNLAQSVIGSTSTLLRALHYPPVDPNTVKNAVRAAAHEDINFITLLPAATNPGLQIKDSNGHWHNVQCEPNDVIVNVGDMLTEATNGFLPSTTHRVVVHKVITSCGPDIIESRYSMPLFVHPRPNTFLSSTYSTAELYLNQRLKDIGLLKG
jgi:isopenicillin N synthase-like dioxygenase